MKSSVLLMSMEQTHDDVFVRVRKLGLLTVGTKASNWLVEVKCKCYELFMCCRFEC